MVCLEPCSVPSSWLIFVDSFRRMSTHGDTRASQSHECDPPLALQTRYLDPEEGQFHQKSYIAINHGSRSSHTQSALKNWVRISFAQGLTHLLTVLVYDCRDSKPETASKYSSVQWYKDEVPVNLEWWQRCHDNWDAINKCVVECQASRAACQRDPQVSQKYSMVISNFCLE